MRTLGSQPQRPDQSVTVMPRVSVPVSSTSTVAARMATSCGLSSNATAAASGLDADDRVCEMSSTLSSNEEAASSLSRYSDPPPSR